MHDKSLEPLSAMMDGEIETFELRRLVDRIDDDSELKEKWDRYHLVQDLMQGRDVNVSSLASGKKGLDTDFVSRISSAIESEPTYSSKAIEKAEQSNQISNEEKTSNAWWKPAASMAVAASVTAVVLLGSQQFTSDPIEPVNSVATLSNDVGNGIPPSRFGSELSTVSAGIKGSQAESLRSAQGLERFIQQHKDLSLEQVSQWQVNWVPDGFSKIDEKVTAKTETLLFENQGSRISINIESTGSQSASQGVISSSDILAYGINTNDKFISVVGKLSPQQAAKIAASVSMKN